jgi:hypothetical protein
VPRKKSVERHTIREPGLPEGNGLVDTVTRQLLVNFGSLPDVVGLLVVGLDTPDVVSVGLVEGQDQFGQIVFELGHYGGLETLGGMTLRRSGREGQMGEGGRGRGRGEERREEYKPCPP